MKFQVLPFGVSVLGEHRARDMASRAGQGGQAFKGKGRNVQSDLHNWSELEGAE